MIHFRILYFLVLLNWLKNYFICAYYFWLGYPILDGGAIFNNSLSFNVVERQCVCFRIEISFIGYIGNNHSNHHLPNELKLH